MHLGAAMFKSKVARRFFALFLVTAVIPTAILALVGLYQINLQLDAQTDRELHIQSKLVGGILRDRLTFLEHQLRGLVEPTQTQSDAGGGEEATAGEVATKPALFRAFAKDQVQVSDSAVAASRFVLTSRQQKHLLSGRFLVLTQAEADGDLHVFLIYLLKVNKREARLYSGEIAREFLFDFSAIEPGRVCIADSVLHFAGCPEFKPELSARVRINDGQVQSGQFDLGQDDDRYRVAYWPLFLKFSYDSEPWIIFLLTPGSAVPAHEDLLVKIFPLLAGLVVLLVALISTTRIRRHLIPLERLRTAADQFAASGACISTVAIDSGDEFEDLGRAFNAMTVRISKQFKTLSLMSDIDRIILSSLDAEHVIETLLNRVRDLIPCDRLFITRIQDGKDGTACSYSLSQDHRLIRQPVLIGRHDLDLLSEPIVCSAAALPVFLQHVADNGYQQFRVYPIKTTDRFAACLTLAYHLEPELDTEDCRRIQELTDRAAVALSNAAWQEKLHHQAHYDLLTNLPNRLLLRDRLNQALARAARQHSHVAVLFIDVDRFKHVNDSLGHRYGDELLVRIAQALSSAVRETDTVARFGGDEFIVVLPDISEADSVSAAGRKILHTIGKPVNLAGREIQVTASIGVAVYPEDGANAEELNRNADSAMYQAKQAGRNNLQFYSPSFNAKAEHTLTLEAKLRRALERGEFEVFYQPQFSALDNRLVGAEALLRWHQNELGMISPAEFIPLAEETGLIVPIGEWVLRTACQQAMRWHAETGSLLRMAVNVSTLQFREGLILHQVRRALQESGLPPQQLELEVTESAAMVDANMAVQVLRTLREFGVFLSLDDFGTGYSSLSYLHQLPLHAVKIDKSFIHRLPANADAIATVNAIVSLAQGLQLSIIAEGVETEEQLDFLRTVRCHCVQGYLFSKPIPASEFAAQFLSAHVEQRRVE